MTNIDNIANQNFNAHQPRKCSFFNKNIPFVNTNGIMSFSVLRVQAEFPPSHRQGGNDLQTLFSMLKV